MPERARQLEEIGFCPGEPVTVMARGFAGGDLALGSGKTVRVLDLPGTYSLHPRSPDERITCEVLQGTARGEKRPDLLVCVVDAANLRRGLRLVLAIGAWACPASWR